MECFHSFTPDVFSPSRRLFIDGLFCSLGVFVGFETSRRPSSQKALGRSFPFLPKEKSAGNCKESASNRKRRHRGGFRVAGEAKSGQNPGLQCG
jgi:hypothetical protein